MQEIRKYRVVMHNGAYFVAPECLKQRDPTWHTQGENFWRDDCCRRPRIPVSDPQTAANVAIALNLMNPELRAAGIEQLKTMVKDHTGALYF